MRSIPAQAESNSAADGVLQFARSPTIIQASLKEEMENEKKLTTKTLSLMLFAAVYAFASPGIFYLMGYSAIPVYLIAAIVFFIPFGFMIIEYGAAFKNDKGGIYSWVVFMICGQLATILFSQGRQLVEGAPAKFWPGKIAKIEGGMPKRAMWIQCFLIVVFLVLASFGGAVASTFFNRVILASAVAVSVPYVLIAIAFPIFKKKTEIEKPVTIFKSYKSSLFWTVIVVFSIGLADIITVMMPVMSGDVFSSVVMVAGPIIFSAIAILLYRRYQKIPEPGSQPT